MQYLVGIVEFRNETADFIVAECWQSQRRVNIVQLETAL